MTRNQIYADKNISLAEKNIFLWLNENFPKHKEFYTTLAVISAGVSNHRVNVSRRLTSLARKGYIKKFNHWGSASNSYIICK